MNAKLNAVVERIQKTDSASQFYSKNYSACGFHCEIEVTPDKIADVARNARYEEFYLECLTATDFTECFELVYLFHEWTASSRFAVKVIIPKTRESAVSIHHIFPAANWYEREIHDMYGLKFSGHPNLSRLLLPENSQIHPLLKSFKGEPEGSDVKQVQELLKDYKEGYEITYPRTAEQRQDVYHLNLGPQHPSTHGVLRIVLELKGERVIGAEPVIGYVHRNHEKMAEVQEYKAFWPNAGRLDYVGAMSYNFGFAGLIEKAMAVEASERVQYIRVLLTELNRISSHLLWLGTYLLDLGAFTPFFYCFDDREKILDMIENVTGERLTYDYFRFGGLDRDMDDVAMQQKLADFLPYFGKRLTLYKKLIGDNVIFKKRTQDVGIIGKRTAFDYGMTGPCLRAAGVATDERRREPYSIYPQLEFDIPTQTRSDAYARYLVRMEEMKQSLRIVEQIYKKIPKGDYKLAKLPRFVPKGEYYFSVESARGTFGMYLVSDGTMQPYKLKLRTPSYSNISAFGEMAKNVFMADLISVLGSIDVVIPEIDR